MSFELKIQRPLDEATLASLGRWLEEKGPFVAVPPSSPDRTGFRRTDSEPREQWPEDFELRVVGDETFLSLQGLDRSARRCVVALAEEFLASQGIEVEFEEL